MGDERVVAIMRTAIFHEDDDDEGRPDRDTALDLVRTGIVEYTTRFLYADETSETVQV